MKAIGVVCPCGACEMLFGLTDRDVGQPIFCPRGRCSNVIRVRIKGDDSGIPQLIRTYVTEKVP